MEECVGIDEAGRGPVLGPLVVAIVHWKFPDLPEGLNLDDSKKLTASQRRRTSKFLRKNSFCRLHHIPASVIAASELSLQHLEARVIAAGLEQFPESVPVVCDALGSGKAAHRWVKWELPGRQISFESSADELYDAVSAASVLAKVERDEAIERLADDWGEIGSGYPSDPSTQDWLRDRAESEAAGWPGFVRENWGTVKKLE